MVVPRTNLPKTSCRRRSPTRTPAGYAAISLYPAGTIPSCTYLCKRRHGCWCGASGRSRPGRWRRLQLCQAAVQLVHRQRKGNALGGGDAVGNDANHLAFAVQQRAAAVARIERGVGLEIFVAVKLPPRRDDAPRNGGAVPNRGAQRKAQGNHILPDGNPSCGAQRRRLKVAAVDPQLHYRQVGVSVPAEHPPRVFLPVQCHCNAVISADHMGIGSHQPTGIVHKTRPAAVTCADLH